jgi:uncharacterized membrane protein YbhN (UPF0104 family)
MKLFHLRERGIPVGRGLASVLLDRLLDVAMLLVMAAAGIAMLGDIPDGVVGAAAAVFFVGGVWLARAFLCGTPAVIIGRVLAPVTPGGVRRRVAALQTDLCQALGELPSRAVAGGILLTVLAWGVNYLANYQMAQALGLPLSFLEVAGLSAVASLVVLVPVSIAGVGTREAAMVWVGVLYGLDEPQAIALSTMFLAFILWNAVMCGTSSFSRHVHRRADP